MGTVKHQRPALGSINIRIGRTAAVSLHPMSNLRPDTRLTTEQLKQFPVEQHFRLRGTETTRLDTLVDAAFAFTLTLLVISEEGVPGSFEELVAGMLQLPALLISYAVLMMFWFGHRKWSRRYGIENSFTVMSSLLLVFVLLVYIYPLRLIFEGMMTFFFGEKLPWRLSFTTFEQIRGFFAFYACGFLAMSVLMGALYYSALRQSRELMLDDFEILETRFEMHRWAAAIGFSAASILIAAFVPIQFVSMSGFIFFGMLVYTEVCRRYYKKQQRTLDIVE